MSSPRSYSFAGCLCFCFLIIQMSFADAASFQNYQVPQQDQGYRLKTLQRLPSPDMLKALEYIENLRKQASRTESVPDYNSYQGAPFLQEQKDTQALSSDSGKSLSSDDESEWMRAMLEALMQAEKEAKASNQEKSKQYMDKNIPPELIEDYDSNKWPEKRPRPGKIYSRLYDDYSRDNPLKRTNEIVEGQYTPQNLATLQSVFQELGKLKGQSNNKRDRLEEDQKLYKDDEDDMFKANNIAYEDVAGGEDWNPIEEKIESQTQEELKESKEEVEKTDDVDEEMKRSGLLGLQDEEPEKDTKEHGSENLPNLMNMYLKMMMNRMEKGKENTDKRSLKFSGKDLDPEAIYQLIDISRNLQIPPEDLIDMLREEDSRKYSGRFEPEKEVEVPEDLEEVSETVSDKINAYKSSQGFARQPIPPALPNVPEGLTADDTLNLMGADKMRNEKSALINQIKQNHALQKLYPMLSKYRGHKAIWPKDSEKRQMEYGPRSEKEEELADYVIKMLAKYPELLSNNQNKKLPIFYSPGDLQELEKQYENALRGYLNMRGYQDLETLSSSSRRLPVTRDSDDTQNRQYLDEDLLMKVLEYLNQENAEKTKDLSVKGSMENM
ncbi:secretogranin-2 [Gastrophryne carolinensis]